MKLFKNCPHNRRRSCEGCPMLTHCILRKTKRKIKRKVIASRSYKMSYVMLFILIILLTTTIIMFNNENNKQKQKLAETQNHIITSKVIEEYDNVTSISVSRTSVPITAKPEQENVTVIEVTEEPENEEPTEEPTEEPKVEPEISAYNPSEDYYYIVTAEEKIALEKLVYKESRGEKFEGKVAVAAVVLNRYTSKNAEFDTSSIISVINKKGEFADISDVTMKDLSKVPECEEAVEAALKGWDPTRKYFSTGALYFYEPNIVEGYQKEIRQGIEVYPIGNHNFHVSFKK